jgi:hypothetical protein
MIWYEDLTRDIIPVIRTLASFTGFDLSDDKIDELAEILELDNYRRHHADGAGPDEFERDRLTKESKFTSYFQLLSIVLESAAFLIPQVLTG